CLAPDGDAGLLRRGVGFFSIFSDAESSLFALVGTEAPRLRPEFGRERRIAVPPGSGTTQSRRPRRLPRRSLRRTARVTRSPGQAPAGSRAASEPPGPARAPGGSHQ